jgi:hypothetical protein
MEDLDLQVAIFLCANRAQVDIWDIGNLVRGEGLRGLIDLVGDALGCRCTVGQVVLDTEVFGGTFYSSAWTLHTISKLRSPLGNLVRGEQHAVS